MFSNHNIKEPWSLVIRYPKLQIKCRYNIMEIMESHLAYYLLLHTSPKG